LGAHELVAIVGAFLLAGFVKGVIGMGLPTVAIGLLGLIMTPTQAAAVLVVPSLLTNVWQFMAGGDIGALLKRMWPMLAGICLGTALGALLLPRDDAGRATIWLGIILVVYSALGLLNLRFHVQRRQETRLGLIMGIVNGVITVATGVFVVPGTPYIQSMEFEPNRLVQALGLSFTVSTIALAIALAHAGEMNPSLAVPTALALVASVLGMWIGQKLRGRVTPETFRRLIYIGLLVLGAHLALHRFL
jgi:uncharacterized membrane protein YfcA